MSGFISRRKFLKRVSGATGLAFSSGILAPQLLQACQSRKTRSLGVALVGLGYYSTDLLAPALQQTNHCHLAGIVTGSPWKIPKWQSRHGISDKNVYHYDNMHEVANNEDIDVIYIVLPNSLHCKYSMIAAEAGKHVWCEKPMALTVVECQKIIDSCKANKVKLSIGYRMQHEPNTRTLMRYSKKLPYGTIKTVEAEAGYYNSSTDHWKLKKDMGGGAMYDMGVYPLNASRYTTGKTPVAVTASQSTSRHSLFTEVDETTVFTLEFEDGIMAECTTSFGKNMNLLQVNCERGWYKLQPFQAYNGIKGITSEGIPLKATIPNQQARQMDDDALAILNDKDVMVPGEEGLKDIAIVEAIFKSAQLGRRITL